VLVEGARLPPVGRAVAVAPGRAALEIVRDADLTACAKPSPERRLTTGSRSCFMNEPRLRGRVARPWRRRAPPRTPDVARVDYRIGTGTSVSMVETEAFDMDEDQS
jgi:hypothetical protein